VVEGDGDLVGVDVLDGGVEVPADRGLEYTLVVSFEPRPGLAGLFDRSVVRYATSRALRRTLDNLERQLPGI
jgi:hypothetical protein